MMRKQVMLPLHISVPWEMRELILKAAERNGKSIGATARELLVEGIEAKGIEEAA